jgi:hypothetical protein
LNLEVVYLWADVEEEEELRELEDKVHLSPSNDPRDPGTHEVTCHQLILTDIHPMGSVVALDLS